MQVAARMFSAYRPQGATCVKEEQRPLTFLAETFVCGIKRRLLVSKVSGCNICSESRLFG